MKSLIKYLLIIALIVIIFLNLNFLSKIERRETFESPKVQHRLCPFGSRGKCYMFE